MKALREEDWNYRCPYHYNICLSSLGPPKLFMDVPSCLYGVICNVYVPQKRSLILSLGDSLC